jgi:hypothetical protein
MPAPYVTRRFGENLAAFYLHFVNAVVRATPRLSVNLTSYQYVKVPKIGPFAPIGVERLSLDGASTRHESRIARVTHAATIGAEGLAVTCPSRSHGVIW